MPPTKGRKAKKADHHDEATNVVENTRPTRSTRQTNLNVAQQQNVPEKSKETAKSGRGRKTKMSDGDNAVETNNQPTSKKRTLKSETVEVDEVLIDTNEESKEPDEILPTKRGRKPGTDKTSNKVKTSETQTKKGRKRGQSVPKDVIEDEPKSSPKKRGRKAAAANKNEENGSDEAWKNASTIYEFKANTIDNKEISLEKYKGHPCIIVNVASKCGYTKANYDAFVELFDKYSEENGLRILAFPCNQFANQEPGDSAKICEFAKKKNVKFDLFEKINVNGDDAHPLWKYLKEQKTGPKGKDISWNFTKFLIDKDGQVAERLQPGVKKPKLLEELEKLW